MEDNQGGQIRRGSNHSVESNSSSSSNEAKAHQAQSATIDFIQNLKVDHAVATQEESDDEVPSYTLSSLVERKQSANLRHLDAESQRPPSNLVRQSSLPSLTSSTSTRGSYGRSESDGYFDSETRKRRRTDDSSSVLTPLYQAVSSGASLDVIQSLVRADPTATGRLNGGDLTPLHCGIERYDTPVSVLLFLLESDPYTAAQKCSRGRTPVDLLWKRYVEPYAYRSEEVKQQAVHLRETIEEVVNLETDEPGPDDVGDQHNSLTARRQARANLYLQDRQELRAFWDIITRFICAACHGTTMPTGARVRLVQDAVAIECSPLLIRFAAALFPEELMERHEVSGRVPLHIAVAQRSQNIVQALLQLQPQAASIRDSTGRLPLHHGIQAQLPWEGGLELLVAAWPNSLTMVDPETGLLPAMSASDCSTDVIFRLFSSNPIEVCRFVLERINV